MAWKDDDALFKEQLRRGYGWQQHVAAFLKLCGLQNVYVPTMLARDTIEDAPLFRDQGDLRVGDAVLEVKSRDLCFTNRWDFPYDSCIVDTVDNFERKAPAPLAYVFVSTRTGAMLCLAARSRPAWIERTAFDHVRNIEDRFFFCARQLLRPVDRLVSYLRALEITSSISATPSAGHPKPVLPDEHMSCASLTSPVRARRVRRDDHQATPRHHVRR